MRALNSHPSVQKLCGILCSRLIGVRWLPSHPVVNYEYFSFSLLILGISQAYLLVPLSVSQRGGSNFQVFWSSEPLFCYNIFLNETICTFYDSKDQWTTTANLSSSKKGDSKHAYELCKKNILCFTKNKHWKGREMEI